MSRPDATELWAQAREGAEPRRPPLRRIPVKPVLLGALIAVVVALVAWWFWPLSPEERIRRRLSDFAEIIDKPLGEGNAVGAAKALQLERFFAPTVTIDHQLPIIGGQHDADELGALILRGRGQLERIDLDFAEVQVALTGEAEAEAVFVATLTAFGGEGRIVERRVIVATLGKIEDQWRFTAFAERPILER